MTGLPVTGRRVEFDGEEVNGDLGRMVRERIAEVKSHKEGRRSILQNYMCALYDLCKENTEEDNIGLWMQLFVWMVLSGLFFSGTPYGGPRCMERYDSNVQHFREYAWAEIVWRFLVQSLDEFPVWFYEHRTRFSGHVARSFPRITKWDAVDHGGQYDAYALLARLKEKEVCVAYVRQSWRQTCIDLCSVILVLYPIKEEKEKQIVKDFLDTDKYKYYLPDGEKQADKLAFCVRDLEARLRNCEDISDYFPAPPPADGCSGLAVADDLCSPDEHYPRSAQETSTDAQREIQVPVVKEHPDEGLGTEEQPLQVPTVEQPNVDESVVQGLVVEEPQMEQSAEEVTAVNVPSLEELIMDVAELKHPTTEVPPFLDPIIKVSGDSLHFTVDANIIDVETSSLTSSLGRLQRRGPVSERGGGGCGDERYFGRGADVHSADRCKKRPRTKRVTRFQGSSYVIPTTPRRREARSRGSTTAALRKG
ncbi:hypothetical protein Cgig2_010827 [Carnegiea gigantea]|uniref:Aminotransferase-like plant mobile domain-containing protein n=1 Tax=Carnegiea gigantea TaxID=171969 RepID=A0A9Q1GT82_9CARY|nr:hypothetical protein Cgig2_010827 [Carnegiea gigantea]